MKRILSLAICLFLLLSVCVVAYAHPGRTDADGGHWDRSTGEYHYHHGYPAHDHYDMDGDGILDCPYNFKDKTGSSSGNSSGSGKASSSISTEPTSQPTLPSFETLPSSAMSSVGSTYKKPSSTLATQNPNTQEEVAPEVTVSIMILIISIIGISVIVNHGQKREIKRLESEIRKNQTDFDLAIKKRDEEIRKIQDEFDALSTSIINLHTEQLDYLDQITRQNVSALQSKLKFDTDRVGSYFDHESILTLIGTPRGDSVGSDGLPQREDSSSCKWGEKYTFYVNPIRRNAKYHTARCPHRADTEINAYSLSEHNFFLPCQHCNPELPDIDWFVRYQKILSLSQKYFDPNSTRENAFEYVIGKLHDEYKTKLNLQNMELENMLLSYRIKLFPQAEAKGDRLP